MLIDGSVFGKLFDFLDVFPHYFIGPNAGLPIVGSGIFTKVLECAGVLKQSRRAKYIPLLLRKLWRRSEIDCSNIKYALKGCPPTSGQPLSFLLGFGF
jgi:hypothetical protein